MAPAAGGLGVGKRPAPEGLRERGRSSDPRACETRTRRLPRPVAPRPGPPTAPPRCRPPRTSPSPLASQPLPRTRADPDPYVQGRTNAQSGLNPRRSPGSVTDRNGLALSFKVSGTRFRADNRLQTSLVWDGVRDTIRERWVAETRRRDTRYVIITGKMSTPVLILRWSRTRRLKEVRRKGRGPGATGLSYICVAS